MEEKIQTRHPEAGKSGVNISKAKYDVISHAIIETLQAHDGEMAFAALSEEVNQRLTGHFAGSVTWYVVTVKLDLEARGTVARVPGTSPQRLRLAKP